MRTLFVRSAVILVLAVTGVVATHHSTSAPTVTAKCQYVTEDGTQPCSRR